MQEGRFHCDRCGLCCRHIGNIPQLMDFDRGDGVCLHLTGENLCDIYNSRPEVCNVDRMYSRFEATMSRLEYEHLMTRSCDMLKKYFGNDAVEKREVMSDAGTMTVFCSDFAKLGEKIPDESLRNLLGELQIPCPTCKHSQERPPRD